MSHDDRSRGSAIAPQDLPAPIVTYLAGQQFRDAGTAIAAFAADAVVSDDGLTYHGLDEIRTWLTSAASEYAYTTELLAATRLDDEHYEVLQRLEGGFLGEEVDLKYRFALRAGLIANLVIEP
jgi:hypothetical protein